MKEIGTLAEYRSCTIQDPEPVFEDKTLDLQQFHRDYDSKQLCRMTRAMENYSVILNNGMCPWKCSTSCHKSWRLAFDIMIQSTYVAKGDLETVLKHHAVQEGQFSLQTAISVEMISIQQYC